MSASIVSTSNVQRIWDAFNELAERLQDPEILGIGIVYGDPGRGKTVTAEQIHSQIGGTGEVQTYWAPAKPTWKTMAPLLKDLLRAMGTEPRAWGADDLLEEVLAQLAERPGIFLIDEIDFFAGKESCIQLIKYLHDQRQCAFLLIGEHKSRATIRRYLSFESRLNDGAIVEVGKLTPADVRLLIEARCSFPVRPEVMRAIYKTCATSARLVVRECRKMTRYSKINGIGTFELEHYEAMKRKEKAEKAARQAAKEAKKAALKVERSGEMAIAAGGAHA